MTIEKVICYEKGDLTYGTTKGCVECDLETSDGKMVGALRLATQQGHMIDIPMTQGSAWILGNLTNSFEHSHHKILRKCWNEKMDSLHVCVCTYRRKRNWLI